MTHLPLARFLVEVRKRSRTELMPEIDALGVLLARVAMNRYNGEGRALARAAIAVVHEDREIPEADLWALGRDALGMLDAFAAKRQANGYALELLDIVADRLRALMLPQ